MKPNDLILYIVDNNVFLYKDKIIKETTKKDLIKNGKVSKPQEFQKFLEVILKKYKLNKGIINNNIIVIIDPSYTQADTEVLNNILEKLSFNKITFINIVKLLNISNKRVWLIINRNYMYLIHINYKKRIESIFIDLKLFKNNLNILIKHLVIFLKKKQVIILGTYNNFEELAEKIEKNCNSQAFYIEDMINYYIDKIKNTLSE